ncbi:MAG: hypothetical protein Q8K59_10040 [Nitrosomonas sp.]|nr:hypothetical protein [Nitrosomonas sp.]MDP1951413.1 hypothetical protein [Nitrosomonas sp.]
MTKRGKQASRKAAARKYGFLEVPISYNARTFAITSLSARCYCPAAHCG